MGSNSNHIGLQTSLIDLSDYMESKFKDNFQPIIEAEIVSRIGPDLELLYRLKEI